MRDVTKQEIEYLNALAQEIAEWGAANFPERRPKRGVLEEVGELSKCFLKRLQMIKGFDNFEFFVNESKDALADIAIFSLHDMALTDRKFFDIEVFDHNYTLDLDDHDEIDNQLGLLGEAAGSNLQGVELIGGAPIYEFIFSTANEVCTAFNTDIVTVTKEVWDKVVSKRDFAKNPTTG